MANTPQVTPTVPRSETIRQIALAALGELPTKLSLVPDQGNVNTAYEVETRNGSFIVRVRFDRNEMRQFIAEKRCAEVIRSTDDWTPQIIAIGKHENHCYSVQEKVPGTDASQYQGDMVEVWEQVGEYAAHFHGIETAGYLNDLFREGPASDGIWCQSYFDYLGQAATAKLVARGLLTQDEFNGGLRALNPLKELEFTPTLAHGNIGPKNIIVDPQRKAHLIDWGNCAGHMASELDLSELLAFDTPREHVQAYLRGHQLPSNYVEVNQDLLRRFQLVRCFTNAHWLCESGSQREGSLLKYVEKTKALIRGWGC